MNNLRTTTTTAKATVWTLTPCKHTHPRGDPGTPTPAEKNQRRSLGPPRAYSLRAGVGRHRQPERLRNLLRRRELHRNGDPLRRERLVVQPVLALSAGRRGAPEDGAPVAVVPCSRHPKTGLHQQWELERGGGGGGGGGPLLVVLRSQPGLCLTAPPLHSK